MDQVTIRLAQPSDNKALCALERAVFDYDQLGERSFRHLIQSPSALVYILESPTSEDILGYAIVLTRRNSKYWRLYSMATSPAARGQGFGKQLLSYILLQAKPLACGLRLEVKCDNEIGLALYRQLGFEVTDLVEQYYSDGSNGYRMQYTWTNEL